MSVDAADAPAAHRARADDLLSVVACSVLGVLTAKGERTIGELAAHERVQPPSMTRTVNCLVEERVRHRRRRTRPTAARSSSPDRRRRASSLAADRRRRDAWLAQRLRELTPDERDLLRAGGPAPRPASTGSRRLSPTFRALAQPQLPAVRHRRCRLQHRHLDAARRPGLAGPRAHRQRRHRARHHDRAAVPADPAALAVRRR